MVPELDFVAAGQVVTDEGAPVARAKVVILARSEDTWCCAWQFQEASASATDQGHFEIRGKVINSRLGLAAELAGWTCVDATPFEVGARDLKVTMVRAGGIAGSITELANHDPRRWVDSPIEVSVVKSGVKSERTGYNDDREPLDLDRREVEINEGKFEAKSLMPGTYSVELYAKSRDREKVKEPLLVVDGVVVRAGETTRDRRVQEIALSKLLKSHVITVVDQRGRPLNGALDRSEASWRGGRLPELPDGS